MPHAATTGRALPAAALALTLGALTAPGARAQSLEVSWWTIDGGGAHGAAQTLSTDATVGQADAGVLSGTTLVSAGGFWVDPAFCPGDFNHDAVVDTRDFIAFLNAWTAQDPRADANGDGLIDSRDVLTFLNAWTRPCA